MIISVVSVLFSLCVVGAAIFFAMKMSGGGMGMGAMGGGGMNAKIEEMNRALFSRTGYRHAAIYEQPIEAQLAMSAEQTKNPMRPIHLVRPVPQLNTQLHFHQATETTATGVAYSASWSIPMRPAFGLHLVDKKLMGIGAAAKGFMSSTTRTITPAYPTEVTMAIPALGDRFKLYASDPARAMNLLMQPDVQQLLTSLKSVDLRVSEGDIMLNDPMMENLHPPGGPMALASMPAAQMGDFMAGAHDRIAQLLVAVASKVG